MGMHTAPKQVAQEDDRWVVGLAAERGDRAHQQICYKVFSALVRALWQELILRRICHGVQSASGTF